MELESTFAFSDAEPVVKRKRDDWGDVEESYEPGPSVKRRSNGTTMAKDMVGGSAAMLPPSQPPKPSASI